MSKELTKEVDVSAKFFYEDLFVSMQGESTDAGRLCIFLRLWGCNVGCQYCIGVKGGRHIPRVITSQEPNKKITEVVIGDKLMTLDDEGNHVETTVKAVHNRIASNHYGVKIEGKKEIFATPEHPFMTQRGWVRADELALGDEIIHITPNEKISFHKKLDNPMHNPEVVKKSVDNHNYVESGKKCSKTRKRLFKEGLLTPSVMSEEALKRMSISMTENNPMYNKDSVKKMKDTCIEQGENLRQGERLSELWKDPEFRESQVQRMKDFNPMYDPDVVKKSWIGHQRPKSGYEVKFEGMCEHYGLDIKFVGDGSLFVGNRNPDFIIPNTNKLVEIYSSSFQYLGKCRDEDWVNSTQDFYESKGYKCICIDLDKKPVESIYSEFVGYYHNGLKVEKIRFYEKEIDTYNFTCEPYNTYLLDYMLVHNCDQYPQGRKKIGSVRRLAKSILDISNVPYVCITGGEPLMQRELLYPLIYELMLNGKEVSVETSGCFPIEEEPYQRSFKYVMDIKCPSSGVEDKNIFDNIFKLQAVDEVKFVVQDRTDYEYALEVIRMYPIPCQILFSPVFKDNKPLISGELLRWMLEDNLINARISIQAHKVLGVL